MDFKEELDEVALTLGMLMSKIVRRCRGDEIGHASKLPLCMRNRIADEVTDLAMEFLTRVNTFTKVENRMPSEVTEDIFAGLIRDAAKRAMHMEYVIAQLDKNEAPLHIIRDKRIR